VSTDYDNDDDGDDGSTRNRDPASLMREVHEVLKATLGDSTSEALMFHLKKHIPGFEGRTSITLADIESALFDLFGSGAEVLVRIIRQRLEEHP
jgi:hypothetical protein